MPGGSAVAVQTAVSSMSRRSFALFRNFFLVAIALWPWLAAQEGLQRAMVGPQIGVRAGFP